MNEKIYLCARFDHAAAMEQYAARLRDLGLQVTSRWHNGSHDIPNATPEQRRRLAEEDEADVRHATTLFFFAEPPGSDSRNGGRHFEMGIARERGAQIIVIGRHENIFHSLGTVDDRPGIAHVDDFAAAVALLTYRMTERALGQAPAPVSRAYVIDTPIADVVRWAANLRHTGDQILREHLADIDTLRGVYDQPDYPVQYTHARRLLRLCKSILEEELHERQGVRRILHAQPAE
jgi:hypothetical protein